MKRTIMVVLFLLCLTAGVSAQSLFPQLSTPTPEPGKEAPSYSAFANAEPDEETDYGSQGTVLTYNAVTENEYLKFGEYLAGFGFEVIESNITGQIAKLMLNNGQFNIGVVYDAGKEVLQVIYEQGVSYQKMDYFPGYTRVTFTDTININKWAEIRMVEFEMNKKRSFSPARSSNSIMAPVFGDSEYAPESWLIFNVLNKTNERLKFDRSAYGGGNDIGNVTLHYINNDGQYSYKMSLYGRADNYFGGADPLENTDLIAGFWDIPSGVKNSTDGTLAITFDFTTGDKYAVILRDNGIEIGR